MHQHQLTSRIEIDTRTRVVAGTLQTSMIDLVFTNSAGLKVDNEYMANSDHQIVKIRMNGWSDTKSYVRKGTCYLDWRKYSQNKTMDKFNKYFQGINIHKHDANDINDMITTAICQTLNDLYQRGRQISQETTPSSMQQSGA